MKSSGENKVNFTEEWDCRDWYAGNRSTVSENGPLNSLNDSRKTRKKNVAHQIELYFSK